MGERAHTLGPWCYIGDQILAPEGVNDDFRIADVYGPDFPANAALIAAAPDMFEALKVVRESFVAAGGGPLSDSDALDVIDAALAKAATSRSSSVEG